MNGSFDAVVRLARGKDRLTMEAVDSAGSAGAEAVGVRCGDTWPGAGPVAAVVAIALLMRWATLGWKDRRGGPRAVQGRGAG